MEFKHLEEVLIRYGRELEQRYKWQVPTASHDLQNTAKFYIEHNGTQYEVGLNLQDYWYYSENGRKAGKFPPISKIEEWIKIKPVIPRERNGYLPTEKQLAFLIARKIAEEGTEGKHTFKNVVEELNNEMLMSIKNAILEDLGDEIERYIITLGNKI